MALKGDRYEFYTDISFFMNEVATRGGVVVISTVGSGAAMDQSAALVTYAANPSGKVPVGMLLTDMVNYDLTRQHINFHKNEVQIGSKVTLGKKGFWVTNNIVGTPAAGDGAFLGLSGNVIPVTPANIPFNNNVNQPRVGTFLSTKDEDGYAKVEINLP